MKKYLLLRLFLLLCISANECRAFPVFGRLGSSRWSDWRFLYRSIHSSHIYCCFALLLGGLELSELELDLAGAFPPADCDLFFLGRAELADLVTMVLVMLVDS